ncbi:Asp-tRNA(Asn)/Glu-tRNA(Gln) amidotransferase GatCAB subunit C [Helicobacter sp. 16-1353]|uniref:Asp-tRNA(Asn)/Glu-tRNA(Gln) amidotransferase subunit GatC n=1 Tax=Helicobacter sp. 16-1353 TaxID=2004996 RepID=UPI000DCD0AD7|nr:Asp-tRNA(Asn)/Glu-tRNA(Gln) amidotransferase subunit GatC [Helicobacter sp. 16-1353]RAX54643.1 Asp-tRNA(Asn)/Glu-tRNA(Gln) amidotransferase GatCAB subunit C [Helicobacter sp. 16-1353]
MIIDDKLLKRLENLSAIEVGEDKKEEIKSQLSEILNFVENLNSLDLPSEIPHRNLPTPLREDTPSNAGIAESVLENAPNAKERFFIVPKIVE